VGTSLIKNFLPRSSFTVHDRRRILSLSSLLTVLTHVALEVCRAMLRLGPTRA